MGEYILNIQEKVEAAFEEVLAARQRALPSFTGLGPPDLVVLIKAYEPPRFVPGLKPQKFSSFHWVSGVDSSSASSIAVYLGTLVENQEKSAFGRGNYRIDGCHFCAYNAFLKMDLHVEIGINNSTPSVYSIGANGERNTVEESFWKETYLSSMLRAITPPPAFLRPLKILPAFKSANDEANFLKLCQQHFWQGRKLGGFDGEFVDRQLQPTLDGNETVDSVGYEAFETDDSNNLLVITLCNYFIERNRYEPMRSFFDEFRKTEPSVASVVAHAHSLMGEHQEAINTLNEALKSQPNSTSLLMALADTYLSLAKKDPTNNQNQESLLLALKSILKSISIKPMLVRGWKIASKVLAQLGLVEWSLIVLNNAPFLRSDTLVDRIGKSKYQRVTPPPLHPNMVTVLEDEEIEFDEEPGDEQLKHLTSLQLAGESAEIFSMLVSMYRKIGWSALNDKKSKILDQLALAVRSRQRNESNSQQPTKTTTTTTTQQIPTNTKDGHNTSSPVNRIQATENTEATNTDGSDSHAQIEESNAPKEGLWHEEDVTSEGSDIEDDSHQQEDSKKDDTVPVDLGSETTTESPSPSNQLQELQQPLAALPRQRIERVKFDENKLNLDDLKDVMESFIDNFGLESTKELERRDYHNVQLGNFSARLPAIEIHRNIELAFHALFQDVKAFQTWREEEEVRKAALDINHLSMKQINATRSFADWIRLGQLSIRLGDPTEAEKLFKMTTHDRFHPKPTAGLIRIFESVGDIRSCLMSSSTLSKYYSEKMKVIEINPTVEKSILNLIAVFGLQKVRTIHASIPELNPIIGGLYLDSVKWRSFGFDK
ncbi:hypothetical protein PPL_05288 [Heterostelium album PN500]|uniref:Uncharacterized protein n=1 Tax=Heterostelium pallidum (strain ATCC 26659 / Pp 5 / PN500) TaxID=670386 RepID=D3BBA1_HETP5|nr:hypothetical protein PPL_05288 [Heterostelium album PN500]EFA81308.1 hypothetical protein PPL_05288 [Heterostelium album PN500]|eukprot:XP_020433426.1 hypothetical protein PPL_05288 [Heterostelium album PN500]